MESVIEFIIFFILVFLGYYLFIVKKYKKYDEKKCPTEVAYFVKIYKINPKNINYHKFLLAITFINALIIAGVATTISIVTGLFLQLILGLFLLIPLMILSYSLLGKYYQNKKTK